MFVCLFVCLWFVWTELFGSGLHHLHRWSERSPGDGDWKPSHLCHPHRWRLPGTSDQEYSEFFIYIFVAVRCCFPSSHFTGSLVLSLATRGELLLFYCQFILLINSYKKVQIVMKEYSFFLLLFCCQLLFIIHIISIYVFFLKREGAGGLKPTMLSLDFFLFLFF